MKATTTAPTVVASIDFADIEGSKENIQPLRRGRNPEKLRDSLVQKPVKVAKQAYIEKRSKLEKAIRDAANGEDPLLPWLNYISWSMETFSSGGAHAHIVPLLEECTRTFKDDPRYKDNVRYLMVWLSYVDYVPEPGDIFPFLKANGIGQKSALFYIAWSRVLESQQKYHLADQVLELGLQLKAHPIDAMHKEIERMQRRAMKRIQKQVEEDPEAFAAKVESTDVVRRPLGALSKSGRRPRVGLGGGQRRPMTSAAPITSLSTTRTAVRSSRLQSRPPSRLANKENTKPVFSVYCDDEEKKEGKEGNDGVSQEACGENLPAQQIEKAFGNTTTWTEYGTQVGRNKENNPEVKPLVPSTMTSLARRSRLAGGSKSLLARRSRLQKKEQKEDTLEKPSTIEVYVDEDCREDVVVADTPSQPQGPLKLRLHMAGKERVEDTLTKNPLAFYDKKDEENKAE